MKWILMVILSLVLLSGCALKFEEEESSLRFGMDTLVYTSGTVIGVSVKMSETSLPLKAVVGYESYELISKPNDSESTVQITTTDNIGINNDIIGRTHDISFGTKEEDVK